MVVGQKLCCSARSVVGFAACLFFGERVVMATFDSFCFAFKLSCTGRGVGKKSHASNFWKAISRVNQRGVGVGVGGGGEGGGVRGEEKDEGSPIPFMKSLLGTSPHPPSPNPHRPLAPSGRIRSLAHNAEKSSGVVQNKVD